MEEARGQGVGGEGRGMWDIAAWIFIFVLFVIVIKRVRRGGQ